ncbi:MAG: hypothetical protein ACRC17_04920 [Culicoidibacterales bacterium]
MKNQKKYLIVGGITATAFTLVGAFAFFNSSDSVTNPFSTGSTRGGGSGIQIVEDFKSIETDNPTRGFEEYDDDSSLLKEITATNPPTTDYGKPLSGPTEVLPGEKFVKQVRIDSEAKYYQYLRVKVIIDWDAAFITKLMETKALTKQQAVEYANSYLEVVLPDKGKLLTEQNWLGGIPRYTFNYVSSYELSATPLVTLNDVSTTGYLYYKFAIAPSAYTADIISSVKLLANAGNEFQNAKFEVLVDAEAIQATQDSWYVLWGDDLPPIITPPEPVTP